MPHVPDTVSGKRVPGVERVRRAEASRQNIRGGSRMQESCTYGSVRGAPSNGRPYRNREIGSVLRLCRLSADLSRGELRAPISEAGCSTTERPPHPV